jgi:hypothetical protein
MKKTNLVYIIGIGLLICLPFIRVSVAAPPAWVLIQEDDIYIWEYNNHTAGDGAWADDWVGVTALGVLGIWVGPFSEDQDGYGIPGNMTHEIDYVGDLGPDLEYGSNFQSVEILHAMTWNYSGGSDALGGGSGGYPWADKDSGSNIWPGLIIENATEFAWWHSDLTLFFDAYSWQVTTLWVHTNLDWSEVVATANVGLAAVNATATVETDGTDEVGFTITIAASAWGTNTQAIGLTVIFDDCGLLDTWDLTYGTDTIMDVNQIQGIDCAPAVPPAIPGFELPIVIGVASIMSLILIKKIKKK